MRKAHNSTFHTQNSTFTMPEPVKTDIQKSLAWAMGTPELPGVRRRVYYTSKNDILVWSKLPHNEVGRVTSSVYDGSFTLKSISGR